MREVEDPLATLETKVLPVTPAPFTVTVTLRGLKEYPLLEALTVSHCSLYVKDGVPTSCTRRNEVCRGEHTRAFAHRADAPS